MYTARVIPPASLSFAGLGATTRRYTSYARRRTGSGGIVTGYRRSNWTVVRSRTVARTRSSTTGSRGVAGRAWTTGTRQDAARAWTTRSQGLALRAAAIKKQESTRRSRPYVKRKSRYVTRKTSRSRGQTKEQGRRRLAEAQKRAADTRRRLRAQRAERARRIAAHSRAPSKRAGVRAWENYYARIKRVMPQTVRRTQEQYDKGAFYKSVAGKRYVAAGPLRAGSIGTRPGVTWMFPIAYGGDMPKELWDAWINKTMTADQIARRVAADYTSELNRQIALRQQYYATVNAWHEGGQIGPRPERQDHLIVVSPSGRPAPGMPTGPATTPPATRLVPGQPPPLVP